jgi:phosphate-selective porin OprO and OprP
MSPADFFKPLCFFLLLLSSSQIKAQEETRYQDDSTNMATEEPFGSVQVVRLKQGYQLGDGITFRSTQGNLNFNQTLQTVYSINSANKNLSSPGSSFEIPRARLNIFGNIFDNKISLSARLNFSSDFQSVTTGNRSFSTVLQEANIEYRPNRSHAFNFGLRADYIDSRETRIEGESLGFIDRSAVSEAFDAIFDFGIRYKGNYRIGKNQWIKSYASITTGDSRSGLQKNYGGLKYGIRLDYLPFGKFARYGEFYMDDLYREDKPRLVIGVVYSFNESATSAKGTNGGRWVYGANNLNELFPSYSKFGADYLFKYKGFYSLASFVSTSATVPTGIKGEYRLNGTFSAYPTTQTDAQTKNIVLSRLNLGSGFNFQAGYLLPSNWAIGARYSSLNSDVITASYANLDRYYAMVITRYVSGHNLKVQLQAGYNELQDVLKTATQSGTYYSQIQFTIQL